MMNRDYKSWRRTLSGVVIDPLVVVTLGGASFNVALAQETTVGVLGEPAADTCEDSATEESDVGAATTYQIVSEESAARYHAQEELAGRGVTEAVGETTAIIGTIQLDEDRMPLVCTRFDVDLRTLTSDEARRDNYLYTNTLETEQYPLATFIVTEVEGLDGPLAEGEDATFTLIGNLTMHGVTRLVAWETTATLDGDTLVGSASTSFDMSDFEIEEPVVGPVISVNETITLEVDLTAEQRG